MLWVKVIQTDINKYQPAIWRVHMQRYCDVTSCFHTVLQSSWVRRVHHNGWSWAADFLLIAWPDLCFICLFSWHGVLPPFSFLLSTAVGEDWQSGQGRAGQAAAQEPLSCRPSAALRTGRGTEATSSDVSYSESAVLGQLNMLFLLIK